MALRFVNPREIFLDMEQIFDIGQTVNNPRQYSGADAARVERPDGMKPMARTRQRKKIGKRSK